MIRLQDVFREVSSKGNDRCNNDFRVEGWLFVCEEQQSMDPRASSQNQEEFSEKWHQGYCVARTDDRSLICYKHEKHSRRDGSDLPRVRLDGGLSTFLRYWKLGPEYESYRAEPIQKQRPRGGVFNTLGRMTSLREKPPTVPETSAVHHFSTFRLPTRKYAVDHDQRFTSDRSWKPLSPKPLAASAHNLVSTSIYQEGPGVALLDESQTTPQRLANFLTRPFKTNPLKRTKSVSKLDRRKVIQDIDYSSNGYEDVQHPRQEYLGEPVHTSRSHLRANASYDPSTLRSSRSHESLLSYSKATHMIDLSDPETQMHPVHPSVLDVPNCFRVANTYYACRTPLERAKWMDNLRRTMNPRRDSQRRTENALQVWVLEAKGVPSKRRYFCELCLDKTLYARTSAKPKQDICFWGQHFEFSMLPKVEELCVNLYREADPKKKKDRCTLIGYVHIRMDDLAARHPVERWYTVVTSSTDTPKISLGKNNSQEHASVRIKARWQQVEILPLHAYDELLNFTMFHYLPLCLQLEPILGVKTKEDLATSLVRILHKKRMAKDFLCSLIMSEVDALDNEHLMFRGNSLATKSMEAFMKLVAEDYLKETLADFVRRLLESSEDCEVDPLKLVGTSSSQLDKRRALLMGYVETAWRKIINSTSAFPLELREVFEALRCRLQDAGRGDLADNLVSSSIFLRFLCPAILSPSLFDLVPEYPSAQAGRNLTLIAKTLQTLANFTRFGGKESYMEFMNEFVEREWESMHEFLLKISRCSGQRKETESLVDEGKELSLLATYLDEVWTNEIHENALKSERRVMDLRQILNDIGECKRRSISSSNNHSISDYDNNSILRARNHNLPVYSPPCPGQAIVSRPKPAPHLNTSDDYVLSTAFMDESVAARQANVHGQEVRTPSRLRPELCRLDGEATTSSQGSVKTSASSSTSEPRDEEDSESDCSLQCSQRSRPKRRGLVEVSSLGVCGSDPPASSGYQSNNLSSISNSSSSSSPVERTTALAITNPVFGSTSITPSHTPFRRPSPPRYSTSDYSNYKYQQPTYSVPPDVNDLSHSGIPSSSHSPASSKASLPRTNPNAWQRQQPTQRVNSVPVKQINSVPQCHVEMVAHSVNRDPRWDDRYNEEELQQWSKNQQQQLIIDEQKKKIERLIRENEELKRQMKAANDIPINNRSQQHLYYDVLPSEDSFGSFSSMDRMRVSGHINNEAH